MRDVVMISLVPTTRENWKDALNLQVQAHQNHFAPSVAVSLAKVHIRPDGDEYKYLPFCVYNAEDRLVGFVMITVDDTTTQSYWLNGLIIDKNEQGKGYGEETINSAIRYIRENYSQSECVNLTVCVDNVAARKLYEKLGFCETGFVYEDEVVYRFTF